MSSLQTLEDILDQQSEELVMMYDHMYPQERQRLITQLNLLKMDYAEKRATLIAKWEESIKASLHQIDYN